MTDTFAMMWSINLATAEADVIKAIEHYIKKYKHTPKEIRVSKNTDISKFKDVQRMYKVRFIPDNIISQPTIIWVGDVQNMR